MIFSPFYRAYMRSDLWKLTRLAALRRAGYCCRACGARRGLQVHHLSYARLGRELPSDLVVYCRSCHRVADFVRRATKASHSRKVHPC